MGRQVTERELKIVALVGRFGMVDSGHIGLAFGLSVSRRYQLLSKLSQLGWITSQRVLHGHKAVYTLTKAACREFGYSAIKNIPLGTYQHDMLVVQACLRLAKHYDCAFLTERELRAGREIGNTGHLPDFVLLREGKQTAVEVELSVKGKYRLARILKFYQANLAYAEVIYLCSPVTYPLLQASTKKLEFIRVLPSEDFLS